MAYSPRLLGQPSPPSQIGEKLAKTWDILQPYVTGPYDAFWRLAQSPAASGFEFTEQDAADALTAGGGAMMAGSVVPKPANALNMGMKVFRAGTDEGRGNMTFYATEKRGAEPYARGSEYPVREVEIDPRNMFDAKSGDGVKLYREFLNETGNPAGYGKTGLPFWTAAEDLAAWLKSKGYDFDAIKFDENTGVPSVAVLNRTPLNSGNKGGF